MLQMTEEKMDDLKTEREKWGQDMSLIKWSV